MVLEKQIIASQNIFYEHEVYPLCNTLLENDMHILYKKPKSLGSTNYEVFACFFRT